MQVPINPTAYNKDVLFSASKNEDINDSISMKHAVIIPSSSHIQLLRTPMLFMTGLQADRGHFSGYKHNGTYFSLQRYHEDVGVFLGEGVDKIIFSFNSHPEK